MKKNYKLLISYDGSRYYGWEHQPNADTIQGQLEMAIMKFYDTFPEINGAGRTDAGVHARGMVANVFLDVPYEPDELKKMINNNLPDDIAVLDVRIASDRFHARYCAVGKTYCYRCHYGDYKVVFDRKYVVELDDKPSLEKMKEAARLLTGRHDYASFCRQAGSYASTIRVVDKIDIDEENGYYTFTFHGTGFMRNMVRIMVGTLLEAGWGKINVQDITDILEGRNRELAGYTADARGLCLMKVDY